MIKNVIRKRHLFKLISLETLVNAWSFLSALEQIFVTCSLNVRPLSILTPNNTSCFLAFIVDPIIFIGLSANGLSKTWNFPGLALKPLLKPFTNFRYIYFQFLSHFIKALTISTRDDIVCINIKLFCVVFHKKSHIMSMMKRRGPIIEICVKHQKRLFRKSQKLESVFVFFFFFFCMKVAIGRSCEIQSKIFDRSVKTAAKTPCPGFSEFSRLSLKTVMCPKPFSKTVLIFSLFMKKLYILIMHNSLINACDVNWSAVVFLDFTFL